MQPQRLPSPQRNAARVMKKAAGGGGKTATAFCLCTHRTTHLPRAVRITHHIPPFYLPYTVLPLLLAFGARAHLPRTCGSLLLLRDMAWRALACVRLRMTYLCLPLLYTYQHPSLPISTTYHYTIPSLYLFSSPIFYTTYVLPFYFRYLRALRACARFCASQRHLHAHTFLCTITYLPRCAPLHTPSAACVARARAHHLRAPRTSLLLFCALYR